MQTANSSKRSNLRFYYAGSVTKSSKRWRSGMSAWCIFQQSCFSHLAAQGTSLTAHRKSPPRNQLWEVSQPAWSQDFARSSDTFVKNSVICGERTRYQRAWLRIWIDTAQSFPCPLVNLEQYVHPGFGQVHRLMRSQPCFLAGVTMTILCGRRHDHILCCKHDQHWHSLLSLTFFPPSSGITQPTGKTKLDPLWI